MSVDTRDVSLIQDEDLLRKMWQDTDDFGRKKEIRSHMYKLREQRLREFYNNGENLSTQIHPRTIGKVSDIPGHADSLADHSFLSLKSKEIRDSESPTKDGYSHLERHNDKGWTISSANERSIDGKRYTSSQTAATSGTETLHGGKIDYTAKTEHMATVYADGDEHNFTKSVGKRSNSILKQEAVTGDENSNMRTTSVKTSSSSKIFKESKSSHDSGDYTIAKIGTNDQKSSTGSKKVYTTNAPADLIAHPAHIEGKTQVIRETVTLPDGTVVTTTRYDTKGGTTWKSESTENYSSNISRQQNSTSSLVYTNNSNNKDDSIRSNDNRTENLRKNVILEKKIGLDDNYHNIESKTHFISSQHTDDRKVDNEKVINQQVEHLAKTNIIEDNFDTMSIKSVDSTLTDRNISKMDTSYKLDNNNISKDTSFLSTNIQHNKTEIQKSEKNSKLNENLSENIPTPNDMTSYRIRKRTAVHNVPKEYKTTKSTYIDNSNLINNNKIVRYEFIDKECQHEQDTKHNEILSGGITNNNKSPRSLESPQSVTSEKPSFNSPLDKTIQPNYETTYRGDCINKKISTEVSPTHDAFARSLRSVSPERILNKSPSPTNHSLKMSNSLERKKTSSLSPERKVRNKTPSKSINRFSSTETITYDKRLSPEKRLSSKSPSPSGSVKKYIKGSVSTEFTTTTRQIASEKVNTLDMNNTSNRNKETPITKTRSTSPTSMTASEIEYIRHVDDIITDLDEETHLGTKTKITIESGPSSLKITTKNNRRVAERSSTSPLTPSKDLIRKESVKSPKDDTGSRRPGKYYPPEERTLKRTDTYEERCRQILGLSEISQKRRGSVEKTVTRKSSFRKEVSSPSMDVQRKSPKNQNEISYPRANRVHEQTNSVKNIIQIRKSDNELQLDTRSPIKDISNKQPPLRKSPEKEQFRNSPQKELNKPQINENLPQNRKSLIKTGLELLSERNTMKDSPSIKEYPSQIRKTPEKKNITSISEQKPKHEKSPSEISNLSETQVFKPNLEIYEPSKKSTYLNEFPSQIRKSPPKKTYVSHSELNDTVSQKQQLEEITYPKEKSSKRISPPKDHEINEFLAQRRVSPEKDTPVQELPETDVSKQSKYFPSYNGHKKETNARPNAEELFFTREIKLEKNSTESIVTSTDSENLKTWKFSTQKEKSPEKPSIGPYSINQFPPEENHDTREFPSQVWKTPIKQISQDSIMSENVSDINEVYTKNTRLSEEKDLPVHMKKELSDSQNIDEESSDRTPNKRLLQKGTPQINEVQSSLKQSPRRIPESPKELKDGREVPSQKEPISKIINTKENKQTSQNKKTGFVSEEENITSSSEDAVDTAEEIITKTRTKYLENRQPVRELEIKKKFISALCSEDKVEKTNLDKKTTENIIQEEIENQVTPMENMKEIEVPRSGSKNDTIIEDKRFSVNNSFIENERSSIKETNPRIVSNKINPTIADNIRRKANTKKITPITKKSELNKSKIKEKVTLMNIEKENLVTGNRTVHIRTHHVDDDLSKKNRQKQLIDEDFSPVSNKERLTKTVSKHNLESTEVNVEKNTKKSTEQFHPDSKLKKTAESMLIELKPKKFITKPQSTPTEKSNIHSKQVTSSKMTINKQIKPKILTKREKNSKQIVKNNSASQISSPKVPKTENKLKNPSNTKIVTVITKAQPTRTEKQMEQTVKKTLTKSNAIKEKRVDTDVDDSLEGSDVEIVDDIKIKNGKQTYTYGIHKITGKTEITGQHLKMDRKNERRCITTKTIIINNQIDENTRSKSSREPTTDRLCTVPLSSDEETSRFSRYSVNIVEPDDKKSHRQPTKLYDIPILEADVSNDKNITKIYQSGNEDGNEIEKRSHYEAHTAGDIPIANEEEDVSVISVSDKVSNFITTAEQLISPQHTDISRSVQRTTKEEINNKVSDKIKQFTTETEKIDKSKNLRPAAKVPRPELEDIDESIKKDECMLSVSDKVSKFISTAEKLTAEVKGQTVPTKILHKSGATPISPEHDVSETQQLEKLKNLTLDRSGVDTEALKKFAVAKDTKHIKSSNKRTPDKVTSSLYDEVMIPKETTSERHPSNIYLSIKTVTHGSCPPKREEVTDLHYITSGRCTSQEGTKTFLGTVGRLRSTESIKKAKELFENIPKEQQIPKQCDILSRPYAFDERTDPPQRSALRNIPRKKLSYPENERDRETTKITTIPKTIHNLKELPSVSSTIPHYMVPLYRGPHSPALDKDSKTPEKSMECHLKEPMTGSGKVPHYMTPLDRRAHSPSPESGRKTVAKASIDVHIDSSNVPHYMTVLDRRPHSPSPDNAEKFIEKTNEQKYEEFHTVNDNVPHYMTPLDRKPDSSFRGRETKKTTSTVTDNSNVTHSDSGKVPHYMLSVDRRPHSPLLDTEHTKITQEHKYKENYTGDSKVPHYMMPLDRRPHSPSPDRTHKRKMSHEKVSESTLNQFKEIQSQNNELPHYMTPLNRSHRPHSPPTDQEPRQTPEKIIGVQPSSRSPSLERRDFPHYMLPLERQLKSNDFQDSTHQPDGNENLKLTKFGISLKKIDSKNILSTPKQSILTDKEKYITANEKSLTDKEIEDLVDLEILEELLIRVVGYDLRKKITAQIRLVKKLITENSLQTYVENSKTIIEHVKQDTTDIIQSKKPTGKSHERLKKSEQVDSKNDIQNIEYNPSSNRKTPDLIQTGRTQRSDTIERRNSNFSFTERKTSSDYTTTSTLIRRSQTPEKCNIKNIIDREKIIKNAHEMKSNRTENKETSTKLKTTIQIPPKSSTEDGKPEWVKQRNLRKISETNIPTGKKTIVNKVTTRTEAKRVSPVKENKPTDLITSSYGVGPTDENGTPLFGLRALRAQNKVTKVQGTVITSEYHSENGQQPMGRMSVTKYSSDPKDFGKNDSSKNGITTITTTQKFGYKDTPSLETLTSSQKKITEDESSHSKSTKVSRRNSVKAISQKFIDNAVETLKNEKQSSYPKAGLILRTSSFKENGQQSTELSETLPAESDLEHVTVRTTSSTKTVSGIETFLTNRSRVSGVQDVICRMKTEESREGDTEQDTVARDLLNKFIGSQLILSGIESKTSSSTTHESVAASPVTSVERTTKISTIVTGEGKPETINRVFQRPIAQEELDTIWEEQTLRLLLEQSTDYEERRLIRARLRQVMAEQEACTELVEKASQEQSSGALDERTVTTDKTVAEGPITTKSVTKITTQQISAKKTLSPFAKFHQLDKQNSLNTPPSTPGTPKTPLGSGRLFKFTDPAIRDSASTIKERLLYWCRMKTKEYENVQLDNFSTSWADGLAFCALIHHFLPDAFDYHDLKSENRRHNFELAFKVADEKADIFPLLDVDDMVATRRPDWKCVFTYVQSIYRRFKDEEF